MFLLADEVWKLVSAETAGSRLVQRSGPSTKRESGHGKCIMNDLSEWRVLIVDDDPENVGVLELVLDFNNVPTRTASSGQECLQLMHEERPSVVLVDIQMPEMSGYDLLNKIRENKQWNDIPIIAVTAHAMRGDEERIIQAGFSGYISKPVNVTSLIDDLRDILDHGGRP
jgi:CheY-like chemotaxis protein